MNNINENIYMAPFDSFDINDQDENATALNNHLHTIIKKELENNFIEIPQNFEIHTNYESSLALVTLVNRLTCHDMTWETVLHNSTEIQNLAQNIIKNLTKNRKKNKKWENIKKIFCCKK